MKTKEEARAATNGVVEIVEIGKDTQLAGLSTFKAGNIANPLLERFTTKLIAEALEKANSLTEGYFTAAVRGREGLTVQKRCKFFI